MTRIKDLSFFLIALSLTSCASVQLPKPHGEWLVGTTKIDLVDPTRVEKYISSEPSKRTISVQAWYPAESDASCARDFYISKNLSKSMQKYMGIPSFIIGRQQYSNSYIDAPISARLSKYPVIVFNHGYGSYSGQNYSQMELLASKGFIVFSISHPHTTVLTEFADGSTCERSENPYWANMKELQKDINKIGLSYKSFLERITRSPFAAEKKAALFELSKGPMYADLESDFETWVGDTVFFVNSLDAIGKTAGILFEKLDLANLGIYGHSFGGSVASEVALRLPTKVKAGINLDGPCLTYEYPKSIGLRIPFMFAYSTDLKIGNVVCSQTGLNGAFYLESNADCYSVTLTGSGHHNFSDMTYIGALKSFSMLGPIDNLRAGLIGDALVSSFFHKFLKGSDASMETLRMYPELIVESR